MRKLLIAVLAVAAVFAVASVAVAANVYKVHWLGSTTVKGKGTKCQADPHRAQVRLPGRGQSDATKRGTVIEQYAIGVRGPRGEPEGRSRSAPSLSSMTATVPDEVQQGAGRRRPREERGRPEHADRVACRQLAVQPASCGSTTTATAWRSASTATASRSPPSFESNEVGCAASDRRRAINGKFVKTEDRRRDGERLPSSPCRRT